jgi:hypothetical protein
MIGSKQDEEVGWTCRQAGRASLPLESVYKMRGTETEEGGLPMFSKCTSLFVTGLALLTPLAIPATSQAQPQVVVAVPVEYHRHHHHRYFVEFRPFPHTRWQVNGPYRSQTYAHDVARDLRARGFQTRVVRG